MKKTKDDSEGALSNIGKKIKKRALLSRIVMLETEVKRLKDALGDDATNSANLTKDR